jgi:hypothetical protein
MLQKYVAALIELTFSKGQYSVLRPTDIFWRFWLSALLLSLARLVLPLLRLLRRRRRLPRQPLLPSRTRQELLSTKAASCTSSLHACQIFILTFRSLSRDVVNTNQRTLAHGVTVSGGVNVEGCTVACKAAGFPLAGLEFGQECCELQIANLSIWYLIGYLL